MSRNVGYSLFILCMMLWSTSCLAPRSVSPVYSKTLVEVGDVTIKEDLVRTRMHLLLNKYPKDFFDDYESGPVLEHPVLGEIFKKVLQKMQDDAVILEYGRRHEKLLSPQDLTKKFEQYLQKYGQKSVDDFLTESGLAFNRWKQMIEERLQIENIMDLEFGKKISVNVSEIQSYYNKNLSEFHVDEQVRVRHIVTDSKGKAEDLRKRIAKGENFAKLAINHSISPDRAKGGDLGFFSRGSFPKIFDDTCFKLEKGAVSPVVRSEYGWHIFKLLDKKPPRTKTLKEAAGQIQQRLMQDKMARFYSEWMKNLQMEIPIKKDEAAISGFSL